MPYKIYLSPSMQKHNIYATGNTNEMEQCNKIANSAQTALNRCGFVTKKAPQGQSMQQNISESNTWLPDLHVAIHTNAANGKSDGTLVMIYKNTEKNSAAANAIYQTVFNATPGNTKRAVQIRTDLAELKSTKSLAVYVECEFHDNPAISDFIINNTEKIGEAIAEGICKYFGKNYILNTTENADNSTKYKVQIGAFNSKTNAEKRLTEAKNLGFADSFISQE